MLCIQGADGGLLHQALQHHSGIRQEVLGVARRNMRQGNHHILRGPGFPLGLPGNEIQMQGHEGHHDAQHQEEQIGAYRQGSLHGRLLFLRYGYDDPFLALLCPDYLGASK